MASYIFITSPVLQLITDLDKGQGEGSSNSWCLDGQAKQILIHAHTAEAVNGRWSCRQLKNIDYTTGIALDYSMGTLQKIPSEKFRKTAAHLSLSALGLEPYLFPISSASHFRPLPAKAGHVRDL